MNSVFFRNPVMLQIKLKTKKTCYMSAFTLKVQLTVRDWIIQSQSLLDVLFRFVTKTCSVLR